MPRTVASRRKSVTNFPFSLYFPGAATNSVMDVGADIYNYERTQPFSVAFWLYPLSYPVATRHILSDYLATGTFRGRFIRTESPTILRFSLVNTLVSNELRCIYIPPNLAKWTRVVFTYDGSSTAAGVKCYFDNVLQTKASTIETLSATTVTSGINTRWGNWGGGTGLGLSMFLAKPAVLNYEMTSGQVADDWYDSRWSGNTPVDWYPLSEGSSTSVASLGTGNHTGTLGAGVTWSTNTPGRARTAIPQNRLPTS